MRDIVLALRCIRCSGEPLSVMREALRFVNWRHPLRSLAFEIRQSARARHIQNLCTLF